METAYIELIGGKLDGEIITFPVDKVPPPELEFAAPPNISTVELTAELDVDKPVYIRKFIYKRMGWKPMIIGGTWQKVYRYVLDKVVED